MQSFNLTTLYAERVKLITQLCDDDQDKICWKKSIGQFYEKIMYPTILKKYYCETCSIVTYNYSNHIKLFFKDFISEDLTALVENSLNETSYCDKCREKMNIQYDLRDILCIDIENLINNENDSIKLETVIDRLDVGTKKLLLVGVIGFEEPINNKKLRHYVAYCRDIHGHWLIFNDAATSNQARQIKADSMVNVALIIYIEYN